MALSARQQRKIRPDLLDRAIDAYLNDAGVTGLALKASHEIIRVQYLTVRSHYDRLSREEREAARKAHSEALVRRAQEWIGEHPE